ncbi:transposase [Sphaerospermopsis aphanizomenoides BCCUSP55]|uniref:RNA-guided endonuclease InsQ/TnpB family protein n=1 Tax=Sphaerospermopsis aphanizomenoides TaxID=459663 RepID=UPI001904CDF2|nr:RNA-guided endonuclease TnpB family protein [Sphaerospermopsis aphanizomenoides]MBK1990014.1 transposase [Sphaerospermopsis aphanizomenoides BCCUSP55]
MLLGFKTQLKVNKQQLLLLAQHAGVARHAWNQGLALCQQVLLHNKLHPEDKIKFPTAIDLHTKKQEFLGVDLGINHLATLSTGEIFDGLKSYKKYEKKLARIQYLNRHKQVGSNNYKKAQIKIARLHQKKIGNITKDTLHKITTYFSKNHAVIGIEDFNVSWMLANGKLSKAISDMGFYEFRRQLEYKTQLYGSKLVIVDRFYPSSKTCSSCGEKKSSLSLSQRVFKCEKCGFECDRDVNAAINLKQEAVRLTVLACGLDSADTSRRSVSAVELVKQEGKAGYC